MINVLSYVGMDLQSEVCLWTLVGLVRTIFDATLFKVNANLKQVWQMAMPEELSMPVQRALRTMISGVMLVQCFTVYVYLATYIVLLYPVFLEERPILVLPWLLLAATRKLLCELTCLALGLGTCVLLGPAKPPCIKFVILKLCSITPAFYVWMLVFSYYHSLKVASAFKTFTVLPTKDHDYGLELAVRRRRTKSLLGEEQLRTNIVASLYGDGPRSSNERRTHPPIILTSQLDSSPNASNEDFVSGADAPTVASAISKRQSETASYEDWYGIDVVVPRTADRILDQFVLMMLRIGAFKESTDIDPHFELLKSMSSQTAVAKSDNQASIQAADDTDTPHFVGSSKEKTASYVREYPQIFMKKPTDITVTAEQLAAVQTVHNRDNENGNTTKSTKTVIRRSVSVSPDVKVKRTTSKRSVNSNQNLPQNKQREEENQPTSSKDVHPLEPLTSLKTTSDDSDTSVLSNKSNRSHVKTKHIVHTEGSNSPKKGLSNGTVHINDDEQTCSSVKDKKQSQMKDKHE